MTRRTMIGLAVLAGLLYANAAKAVPTDEAGFTAYIQQRLQLYAPAPINIVGPLSLSFGSTKDAKAVPSLQPVHDACLREPANCEAAADAYVQNTVHDVLQKPEPASVTTLMACNHTSHTLELASIYVPVDGKQWRNVGWTSVEAGMCRAILSTGGDTFYARAEQEIREEMTAMLNQSNVNTPGVLNGSAQGDGGTARAGSGAKFCVRHAGNWDTTASAPEGTCIGVGGGPVDFKVFHADGRPIHMWNITG
jgi:hypothetical protein